MSNGLVFRFATRLVRRPTTVRVVALGVVLAASLVGAHASAAPPAAFHLPIQGVARDAADALITTGNVEVRVYSDSVGGSPLYDSGTEFTGAIVNGIFDIIVGQGAALSLDPGRGYYLEIGAGGTEVIGDAVSGRWRFFPGGGSRARLDLEARLDTLETTMGLAPGPTPSLQSGGGGAPRLHSSYSNRHALLGIAKVQGSAGGFTAAGNLLAQPVGPHSAGGVRTELGPWYLTTPGANPIIRFVRDVPGDQGRAVRVRWRRDLRERPYNPSDLKPRITSYTLYRRVEPGQSPASLVAGEDPEILALPPGEWDVLTTIPATLDSTYQTVVGTLCDSTSLVFCQSTFLIRSITDQPGAYYNSVADSGYSVDNLAPAVPAALVLTPISGGTRLTWQSSTAPDFQYFSVYRGTDPGFVPGPASLMQATTGTEWIDNSAGPFTYKVTAVDFNGNESVPAVATAIVGVESVTPVSLAFASMAPNPFRQTIHFLIEVPQSAGRVDLAIFDLSGRRTRTLASQALPAGRHPLQWDGCTESGTRAAAGVYVARLTGAGRTLKRRAILLP